MIAPIAWLKGGGLVLATDPVHGPTMLAAGFTPLYGPDVEHDARRYRWLRKSGREIVFGYSPTTTCYSGLDDPHESLDAAIDAAMADEPRYELTDAGRAALEGGK